MTPAELKALAHSSESDSLEFKALVPNPRTLAREIAGFANADGGVLLLGIHELRDDRIVGVDVGAARSAVDRAVRSLLPSPSVTVTPVEFDDKVVVAVEVPGTSELTLAPDGLFVRSGAHTRPATSEQARARISHELESKDPGVEAEKLADSIASLTALVEKQNAQLTSLQEAGRWTRQLLWVLISGVVGAVLGAIATLIIS